MYILNILITYKWMLKFPLEQVVAQQKKNTFKSHDH